jgi:HSP20 family protein
MKDKRSFFERLTGAVHIEDDFVDNSATGVTGPNSQSRTIHTRDQHADEQKNEERKLSFGKSGHSLSKDRKNVRSGKETTDSWINEDEPEGQLTVDVYQTATDIIIKAMVAGVKVDDLDISITRDMVTIKGKREAAHETREEDYFFQELYWGTFSRTILLPQEIQVEEAEAVEKNGLLTITLPKIDKGRQTKLRVKSNG